MTAIQPASGPSQALLLSGIPASAEPFALAELLAGKQGAAAKTILHIAASDRILNQMEAALSFFAPDAGILRFPAWDCLPYDRASPLAALMAERMRTLAILVGEKPSRPRIILTTASAVLQKLPPRETLREAAFVLEKNRPLDRDKLVAHLISHGYRRSGKAMEPGEFALRGSIVDVIPPGATEGVRIDLFGDDIESLKMFDPLTQITSGTLGKLLLTPASEVQLTPENIERFRERYRAQFGGAGREDPLYEAVSEGQYYPGMEHWLPLFYEHTDTLFDYCEGALITLSNDSQTALTERQESILDYYQARVEALSISTGKNDFAAAPRYNPLPPEECFLTETAWEQKLASRDHALFSPFATAGAADMGYRPALRFAPPADGRTPFDELKERTEAAAAQKKVMLLACFSAGSCERLFTLLMERGFHCVKVEHWRNAKNISGKSIGLAVLPIESGFETLNAVILSEQDVLGERISRSARKKKPSEVFLAEAANFNEGEFIVHKEHGIGRFEGLETLTVSGAAHDCLKIIYEGGDRLFLPVENIDMVTRFGLDEENAKLDKLGGAAWQARKARLKERITLAAEALLKTAAERMLHQASVIETQAGTYDEFCSRFPYVETEDQARAISDVLADLAAGKPMDRLVCGDVGFGKTEVALRAAFAVAQDKMQVALIAPTTLLARQHFRNFKTRFAGFPVTVRQLSRFVPAREQKETREQLANGEVDIVIGTHALLSKQTQFKNLGLLIVDEEQHFGVAQKEKLKSLKSGIHVLTLSATPIPRTLQMALTGVRDLSLITTPPIDRLAVRSFVMPFDPVVVREAIQREMHRGGKSFAVTPRIKDIGSFKAQLTALVPEAKIAVAHGQMAAADLDTIMNDFYDGKYDILLSTSIIESGLDVEATNTMIIHNAHLLGLAQLYQLRGRVGRGKLRAYAYFLLPHYKDLTKNATRRLEVMQTLDTLGAGFTLASHDMDIRGFGNLVGEEQSGHIREVGIELYQQMLEEAVAALKNAPTLPLPLEGEGSGGKAAAGGGDFSPAINLGISVLIPEDYVNDLQLRLGLYRRAAGLNTEGDIDSFAAELVDRFGDMPEEVRHFIAVLGIKLLCRRAGIERIDCGPKGAVITFHQDRFAQPEKLLAYLGKNTRTLKARPDNKIVFTHEWQDAADKIAVVKKLAGEIGGLAG